MISVITVTNRPGGIDINWTALRRQTYKRFEWILCDTLYEERKDAVAAYTKGDPRVKHIKQDQKDPKAVTWLNHAENQAIKAASGDLIVFLQDYIHIRPFALEQFWIQYEHDRKRMVTGVGHQYGSPGKFDVVNPNGLVTVFAKPFEQMPSVIVWSDPRMRTDQGSFYPCQPNDIEFNFCAIPRQALYDVGGLDEDYDYIGHAWDNVSVAERAFMLGYEPYIDQSNQSYSIQHDAFFSTTVKENNWQDIARFHTERMHEIRTGKRAVRYPFLDRK